MIWFFNLGITDKLPWVELYQVFPPKNPYDIITWYISVTPKLVRAYQTVSFCITVVSLQTEYS